MKRKDYIIALQENRIDSLTGALKNIMYACMPFSTDPDYKKLYEKNKYQAKLAIEKDEIIREVGIDILNHGESDA